VLIKSNNPSPRTSFDCFKGVTRIVRLRRYVSLSLSLSLTLNDLLYYIIYIYLGCDSRSRAAEGPRRRP